MNWQRWGDLVTADLPGGPPRALLFDLDGTLVDSAPDLAAAVNRTLRELDLPERSEEQVRNWVGNGARVLIDRVLTGEKDGRAEPELCEEAYGRFLKYYQATLTVRTHPYNGVPQLLRWLRKQDFLLGCVSNKAARFTEPLLAELGLAEYFGTVVSGDTAAEKKPSAAPVLHAMETLGVTPAETWMVGDSVIDVAAGRAAGCVVICVRNGYNLGTEVEAAGPDVLLDTLIELRTLLEKVA